MATTMLPKAAAIAEVYEVLVGLCFEQLKHAAGAGEPELSAGCESGLLVSFGASSKRDERPIDS